MTLVVPRLNLRMPVSDGTSRADLNRGPSLFEYSNMPGEGDRVYILYGPKFYTCKFLDRKEIKPTDWSVITNQGFPCLTLITCTPVRVANMRMIVRFGLESIGTATSRPPSEVTEKTGRSPRPEPAPANRRTGAWRL